MKTDHYLGHKFFLTDFYYQCEVCDVKVWFISSDGPTYMIEFYSPALKYEQTCNEQQIKNLLE
jgi:hypothetical protein